MIRSFELTCIIILFLFIDNYEINLPKNIDFFEWTSIKAISPTKIYLTKEYNDIIFDFSEPDKYEVFISSNPYHSSDLPLTFKDDENKTQFFHFIGTSLRFVSDINEPIDQSQKHVAKGSFRGFYDCVYIKDETGHYAYYSYISVEGYDNLRKYGITKLGDIDFDISGDLKNCLYTVTATKDSLDKEGILFIEYWYPNQINLVLEFLYINNTRLSKGLSIDYHLEVKLNEISIMKVLKFRKDIFIICIHNEPQKFGCFKMNITIQGNEIKYKILKDFTPFDNYINHYCGYPYLMEFQDNIIAFVCYCNIFIFFDENLNYKYYDILFNLKVSGKYEMKTTLLDFGILEVTYLKEAQNIVNFDIIYLPTCNLELLYTQINVEYKLSDYFGNTNTTYILFLDSDTIDNQLFENFDITIKGKTISLETKYHINDISIIMKTNRNNVINYIKFDIFNFFGEEEYPFPSPRCKLKIGLCYEDCKTCSGLGTELEMKCTSCFDYFFYVPEKQYCYGCKSIGQYYHLKLNRCFPYIYNGYYVKLNDKNNILYECPVDCSLPQKEEIWIAFCETYPTCSILQIDDELQIINFQVANNNQILNTFAKKNEKDQYLELKNLFETIKNENSSFELIQMTILLNQMLNITTISMSEAQEIQTEMLLFSVDTISCNMIIQLQNENDIDSIFSISYLYYYIAKNEKLLQNTDFNKIIIVQKCLINWAYQHLTLESEYKQEDFSNIIAVISSKLSNALYRKVEGIKNIKTKKKKFINSIIISEERTKLKKSIEEISNFLFNFLGNKYSKYNKLKFYTSYIEEIKNSQFNENQLFIFSDNNCSNIEINEAEIKRNDYELIICISIEDIFIKYPNAKIISLIEYIDYPFLNQEITDVIHNSFTSITIRDINNNILDISNITISFIKQKPHKSFQHCIFYDESNSNISNTNCISKNINKQYMQCTCNHLTDFSLSSVNPYLLFKDLASLFKSIRIIDSLEPFQYLDKDNATILYTVSSIVGVSCIVLPIIIKYDYKHSNSFFLILQNNDDKDKFCDCCCNGKNEIEKEVNELKHKISKKLNKTEQKEINTNNSKNDITSNNLSNNPNKKKKNNISLTKRKFKTYYLLSKEFFINEYFLLSFFLNKTSPISKTNFFLLFIVKLLCSMFVSSLFVECEENDDEHNTNFNNRDLAVSIATILILEIPFMFFEIILGKTIINKSMTIHYNLKEINTKYFHFVIYFIFLVILIFGTVNTTWISLVTNISDHSCKIIEDFIIATLIDCFIYQVITLLLKALIYEFIIATKKSSWIRGCLFCIVSSIPWLFTIEG